MVKFSQEVFDTICERIADGESLRAICKDKSMPSKQAVRKWLVNDKDGDLVSQYAQAREDQADAIFDECLAIADTAEDVAAARLQIDTRKWMAGKLRPKKYSDKLVLGGDEDNPIQMIGRIEIGFKD